MATANQIPDVTPPSSPIGADVLVLLAPMPPEQLQQILAKLSEDISAHSLLIASSEIPAAESDSTLRIIPSPITKGSWTLTAADFVNAYQLAQKNEARSILMLGADSSSLSTSALRDLLYAVSSNQTDLAIPRYDLPPYAGLVNSAILYPLTRALFAQRVRFPLAIDIGLSLRMAERLAGVAQRIPVVNQADSLIWPVTEASVAGYSIHEIDVGSRVLPQPTDTDINAILALVTGSLFADIDAKAAYWQRARPLPPAQSLIQQSPSTDAGSEIAPMIEAFRLAYVNLREIWSLVLPPNTLFGLKRLSVMDTATFRMPDNLWARIVFDFLLAYRLRTINRGHLLGALIPLYLAWVASHINSISSGTSANDHIEAVAIAFEADKPYLVSRWRWPDRFNP